MSDKITPFLWFDGRAEEAAKFYCSIFPNSKITGGVDNTDSAPGETGEVLTVQFELDGLPFIALNGGPDYKFTAAISFSIDCKDQAEVDYYWERLSAGGREVACGWVEDKFGLSWQVVPSIMPQLLGDENRKKADAVMQAMMSMVKLDIAALQAAYDAA